MRSIKMISHAEAEPLITKPGDIARDEDTGEELWKNPEAPKEDADAAFLALVYGKDTPEYFAAMKDLAKKKTTHAPAATAILWLACSGAIKRWWRWIRATWHRPGLRRR
ncbi:MAG: hypothetical protein IPG77_01660 [Betaproteobacteria bacterium]|nr:hypothetical protein [Betaproteobacteria bacterium]